MGKGLKVYLASLTQDMFTIRVADMAAVNESAVAILLISRKGIQYFHAINETD
jgi:hypothetical protein